MGIGRYIKSWRESRGHSLASLAESAGVPGSSLEAIESGDADPTATTIESLASALGIPPSWLYGDPQHFSMLLAGGDGDEEQADPFPTDIDPVTERLLSASRDARELFVLLTALLQSGDLKLIRAAEVNLRSLIKQSRQAAVPWQSRPPGHFEPPSD